MLNAADWEMFAYFRIGPELVSAAQVRRVTDAEARRDGFSFASHNAADLGGIVFPYLYPLNGHAVTSRLRRDRPERDAAGKVENKYLSPRGDKRHLYFPSGSQPLLRDPSVMAVIVEAEKSDLALAALAERHQLRILIIATGGCYGWRGKTGTQAGPDPGERNETRGPLPDFQLVTWPGRRTLIIFDSNASTNPKVQQARRALTDYLLELHADVRWIDLPSLDGVNGPDDFLAIAGDQAMLALLDRGAYTPASVTSNWPEPEPLGEDLLPVPPFDPELLPEELRDHVCDVAERMQVPLDLPAICSVGAMGGAINRRARIQPKAQDGSFVVTGNLWGGPVAPPGWMKSSAQATFVRHLEQIEAVWRAEYAAEIDDFELWESEKELREQAWRENYKAAVKKEKTPPLRPDETRAKPVLRRLVANDPTVEKLHLILAENPAGILLARDELSGWLATLDKPGREGDRQFFLESWNGNNPFTIDRIGRGTIYVPALCLSVFGGLQPGRLRQYLVDAVRDGPGNDGLFQRLQLIVWPDFPADWKLIDRPVDFKASERAAHVYKRLVALSVDEPLLLKFDGDAQQLYYAWWEELEHKVRGGELHPALTSHLAKYRSLMPALAMHFELADAPDPAECRHVTLRHAQQAAAWCEYLEAHARRIYSCLVSAEIRTARELAKKLKGGKLPAEFSTRDVYLKGWSELGTPDQARAALQVLEAANWVRQPSTEARGGRPSERWQVNPKVLGGSL